MSMRSKTGRAWRVHFVAIEILATPLLAMGAVVGPMAAAQSLGLGTLAELAGSLAGALAFAAIFPLYLRLTRSINITQ